ncbi:ATP-binding protein [Nocardioides sp. Kera G14]|uniref:ATP-binding protein n=1 Tax=Nocardioides sp. Kera G14 TaxID=2884264 RepID=UPI001D12AB86|nr:ATP-binding protein [Nocardioides sp. Kera G14]UDY24418.1 ATP-binding protein [Nocardioides sp. Kera G14]
MAKVIVLAGPSGAGKSRLAERLGLPILRLDDFYKDGDDPTLPRIAHGPNQGLIDWDHPDSWLPSDAFRTIVELCEVGTADVPVYSIPDNGRVGHRLLDLVGSPLFVAEGIFAQDIVADCRAAGILGGAYCVTQQPIVTFWRRLVRDLREHRKPPLVLLRRGWALMREQGVVVTDAVAKGCTVVSPPEGYVLITRMLPAATGHDGSR